MTLGQEFCAFATTVREVIQALARLKPICLRSTSAAPPSAPVVAASIAYRQRVVSELRAVYRIADCASGKT